MKDYYPQVELEIGLLKYGIKVLDLCAYVGYSFVFEGDEDSFKESLSNFMQEYGWEVQDEDWFPGDPGYFGEPAYFIMKKLDGQCFEVSLDFQNKILTNVI
jgi:hypothetical protein